MKVIVVGDLFPSAQHGTWLLLRLVFKVLLDAAAQLPSPLPVLVMLLLPQVTFNAEFLLLFVIFPLLPLTASFLLLFYVLIPPCVSSSPTSLVAASYLRVNSFFAYLFQILLILLIFKVYSF